MVYSNVRVLVVDDNPGDVDLVRVSLSERSYSPIDIDVAIRLSEAIASLQQNPSFDCVLLDLSLPDSRGLDTLRRFRAAIPDTPVVILTSTEHESLGRRAIQLGAQDYLRKDTLPDTPLPRIIRYAIERGRLNSQIRVQRDELSVLVEERSRLLHQEFGARAQAENADAIKTLFFTLLSDRLRMPLTSIKQFSDSLLRDGVQWSAEERHKLLMFLNQESDELSLLVEQLLDLSKLRAGVFSINRDQVSLAELIAGTNPPLASIAQRHVVRIEVPDTLPLILADRQRINHVLISLVRHSAQYCRLMTPITVTATSEADQYVRVCIVDEASDLPREFRQRLFEPFNASVTMEEQPILTERLSLTLCREIVEAHGGRIWLDEHPSPGLHVCFTLPTASGTESKTWQPAG